MQVTPEISYKNMTPTKRVQSRVEKELRHIEKVYPRLISCKVFVDGSEGSKRRKGNLARVRLHLGLPGGRDVAVSHHSDDNHAHEDVMVALRDAFRAAERQRKKAKPDPRIDGAMEDTRLSGIIARFNAEEPSGFIKASDQTEYYFHENEVTADAFEDLQIGVAVTFRPDDGEKGPMARAVHRRQSSYE
ncbi:MAG: HPF/RaiA family ribosome-associated protein [Henriciella sp.]|nr:HPF/RaiA family ribosome-associated protein [Henriciella sp.]